MGSNTETPVHFEQQLYTIDELKIVAAFLIRNIGFLERGETQPETVARLQAEGYDGNAAGAYATLVAIIRDIGVS